MKKVLAWTGVAVLVFVLIAFLVSLATPAPQVAAYDPQVAGQPVAPVVVQQPDHFWQDLFLYQLMFGGPRYGYGFDYGYHPWLHPWYSYGIYRQRTIYRTTVIHNTTIRNTVKGSAFTKTAPATAAKPSFWSRTGSLFKAGSARNTAAATAPRVPSTYKPSITSTQSYRPTFSSRALSTPRSSFSSGYRSGGFSSGGGFRSRR